MLDGKKIKRGADVDLLGFETGQTLKQRQDERDKGLNILKETVAVVSRVQLTSDSIPDTTKDDKATVFNHFVSLILLLSVVLRGLRKIRVKKQCGLNKLKEDAGDDWRKSKYAYGIDLLMTLLWKIDNIVDKALQVIRGMCKAGAHLNNAAHLFAENDTVILNSQENLRILKSPENLPEGIATSDTSLIKRRSDKWFEERKKVKVTGSSVYRAVGCDGMKTQKEHFDQVINGALPAEPSEVQRLAMEQRVKFTKWQLCVAL